MRCLIASLVLAVMAPAIAVSAPLEVWVAPATIKIAEKSAPTTRPQQALLHAARREVAAFQLALLSDTDMSGIELHISEFRGAASIAPERVTFWREHYISIGSDRRAPDPLSPLRTLDLKAGIIQPIWIEIDVPPHAKPGDCAARLTVSARGASLAAVPVKITVYDFELPITPGLRTLFGNNDECIAAMEQIPPQGEVFQKYRRAYYEILLAHKISPYNIPVDLMSREADKYLADPRMTSYVLPYPTDDAALSALIKHLREHGWLKKGIFYLVDEPSTKDAFDRLDESATRLKRLVPDYKLISPYCGNPQFKTDKDVYDYLTGRVNVWCYLTSMHWYRTDKLEQRRATGEEIWNYVAWVPPSPHANFLIQMEAIQHRILFWQEWKYRVAGLLYWSTDFWSNNDGGTKDPWTDMATVKWASKDVYGDGSLLYPGHKVGHEGPLPSLRLKLIRQGLQDYDYLKLAAERAGAAKVDAIVNQQVESWTKYQHDPLELDRARERLAELIVQPQP